MRIHWVITILLLCAAAAPAEPVRSAVAGRVADPSGAVIPAAKVSLKEAAGREAALTYADRQGNYALRVPQAGEYTLLVEAPEFASFTKEGLELDPGRMITVDVTLQIEAHPERITVTSKAPRGEEALETRTGNAREVLEIREIRESQAKDAGEALSSLEGIWKIRKGGIANDVVLRGFQQGNLNMLVDGVRIYGACPNHMDPAAFHVDFAELEQVEVTKGAFDITNQGSLGGVVNLVNKTPGRGLHVTPNYGAGSFGYQNPSVTGSLSGNRLWGLAGTSMRRSDPFHDGDGRPFTDYANYTPQGAARNAFDINTYWFRFGAAPTEGSRFEVAYTRQSAGEVLYPYLLMDAGYDNADRLSANYSVYSTGLVKQIRVQTYFTQVKHWMTDEDRVSAVGLARPYSMATFAGTKAMGARADAEMGDFRAGFETYRRNWNAVNTMRMSGMYTDQASMPNVYATFAGAYGEYRKVLGRTRIAAGARVDGAWSAPRSGASTDLYWAYKGTRETQKTDVNPSAYATVARSLPGGVEAFAGLGRTVRVPDPQERYFALKRGGTDWVGDPGLRPTENTEADAGITWRNGRVSLRPTLFYSRLSNFITVHNQPIVNRLPGMMNPAARSFANVDARMYGGEVSYSAALSRGLLLTGGVSYTRGAKDAIPELRIVSRDIAEMPPLKSRAALRYGNRRFFGEVEGIAMRSQHRVDADLRELATPGYAVMNFKAGVHSGKLNFAAGMSNLFDRFYYEHCSYQRDPFRSGARVPEPGRSLFLTASYAF